VTDFPEGFTGAGPVFAAVELGDPSYELAAMGGADSYVVELGDGTVAGNCAFLDRSQAEAVADAAGKPFITHWHGLVGYTEPTASATRAVADFYAEHQAEPA
jgi:hypothetical protein